MPSSIHRRNTLLLISAALVIPAITAPAVAAPGSKANVGHVYVLSNQPTGNSVLVFDRNPAGALTFVNSVPTGGNGAGSGADPLSSQNPVVLGDGGHLLFAVNAGSNSISAFRVSGDKLVVLNMVDSGGAMPVSLAVRNNLLYALNAGGTPNISGFTIDHKGNLSSLSGSTQPLPGGASSMPGEVSFAPGENVLVVTEEATNQIDTFVLANGVAQAGVAFPSGEPTPFGFAFGHNDAALVSDASGGSSGASALSSYRIKRDGSAVTVDPGVGDTQTAACWVAVTKDGRFAYVSNTASNTVSSYKVSHKGQLSLLNVSAASGNVPVDSGLSNNGRFFFVRNAGDGTISSFRTGANGSLTEVSSVGGLPDGSAGLAAR